MAKLDAAERRALPKSEFAGPDRSYPVNDREHAANAKARAKDMLKRGSITQAEYDRICAKADRVLGETHKDSDGKGGKKTPYGKDTFEVGHLQSKDSGKSGTASDPNGTDGEEGGKATGSSKIKPMQTDPNNDNALQRGDMSNGHDGASLDRFYRGKK